uniref:Pecanex-like protein n=1 Tax=Heterorhabditis bacteriophora TaxID=37862 RepID=A0A1I7WWI2_HETBA
MKATLIFLNFLLVYFMPLHEREQSEPGEYLDGNGRTRAESHQERLLFRLDSGSSDGGVSSRIRLLSELGLTTIPSGTMGTAGGSAIHLSTIQLQPDVPQMDRLSVSALFDRNRTAFSCVFDVILAGLVALVACFVLSTGIYFDISLVFFAFTVAGAHFSLLKSVQPDAASPIHGFNWLVVYSRPVYFCVLSVIILFLHYFADDPHNDKIPWNWNPYRYILCNTYILQMCFTGKFLIRFNT